MTDCERYGFQSPSAQIQNVKMKESSVEVKAHAQKASQPQTVVEY